MRRSVAALTGVVGLLLLAACTDRPDQRVLVPTEPSLAAADQCNGNLASTISKQIKDGFTDGPYTDLNNRFKDVIKPGCPNVFPQMMSFIDAFIGYHGTLNQPRAEFLTSLLSNITLYVTGTALVRPYTVFMPTGGADVLLPSVPPGDSIMLTFDGRAGLKLSSSTVPSGPHLFTFDPSTACAGTTSLRVNGNCYHVEDYPDETSYSPPATIGICLHTGSGQPVPPEAQGPTALVHQKAGFGSEVLPPAGVFPMGCVHTTSAMDSWLGQEGGPLGRVVARAYDYLRPRTLFADDAGVSGSIDAFSLVGGVLSEVFKDNFDDPTNFNDGVDTPDLGDAWTINSDPPGFIQQQTSLGDLSGGVVVLSQAQGNCTNCPVFRLLGTRVNASQNETIGGYEVTWQSLQNKPNIKEAPFVILNSSGAEIARLSYISESNNNRLIFTVNGNSIDVGAWLQNVHQDFKVTVNLTMLNAANSQKVSLSIDRIPITAAQNLAAPNATTLNQIGYVLTGIDAGIMVSDNWRILRLVDNP